MASSSGSSEVKKLISKAVSGAITKVLENLQLKTIHQEKPETDADRVSVYFRQPKSILEGIY